MEFLICVHYCLKSATRSKVQTMTRFNYGKKFRKQFLIIFNSIHISFLSVSSLIRTQTTKIVYFICLKKKLREIYAISSLFPVEDR